MFKVLVDGHECVTIAWESGISGVYQVTRLSNVSRCYHIEIWISLKGYNGLYPPNDNFNNRWEMMIEHQAGGTKYVQIKSGLTNIDINPYCHLFRQPVLICY